jgi:hypothetical protein
MAFSRTFLFLTQYQRRQIPPVETGFSLGVAPIGLSIGASTRFDQPETPTFTVPQLYDMTGLRLEPYQTASFERRGLWSGSIFLFSTFVYSFASLFI